MSLSPPTETKEKPQKNQNEFRVRECEMEINFSYYKHQLYQDSIEFSL